MSWRPKGWENPNLLIGSQGTYEAGADAMLKAVVEQLDNTMCFIRLPDKEYLGRFLEDKDWQALKKEMQYE